MEKPHLIGRDFALYPSGGSHHMGDYIANSNLIEKVLDFVQFGGIDFA